MRVISRLFVLAVAVSFSLPAVSAPETPLEAQIQQLESQLGRGQIDPDIKAQLNALYALRPVNQPREHDPLDQGDDTCPGTVVITSLPYSNSGTTAGRQDNYFGTCGYNDAPDVVYRLFPPYSGMCTVSLCGSSYDTYLYVLGDHCTYPETACDDDECGLQSQLTFWMDPDTIYSIVVDGFGTSAGDYVINVWDDCVVNCGANDITECLELPGQGHATNDCNGGCDNLQFGGTPNFSSITPGQTICGRSFAYVAPNGMQRDDSDWYLFTITEPSRMQITMGAEFRFVVSIRNVGCPLGSLRFSGTGDRCTPTTFTRDSCLAAGTYALIVIPDPDFPLGAPREYRVNLQSIPCSSCADQVLNAPGSINGSTCGAGNDCSLLPEEERVVRVTIPHDSRWTFSLCDLENVWDSYLALSSACCGNYIAITDDGCGSYGLSKIECLTLSAGIYYVTIEGRYAGDCGPYTLNVTECTGRCCYGPDPFNPTTCAVTNSIDCGALQGRWYPGETCDDGCLVRPDCFANTLYGQPPHLPNENANGYGSDIAGPLLIADNFSGLSEPIGAVRFWGWNGNTSGPCNEPPMEFTVSFHADSSGFPGPAVCSHTETLFPQTDTYFYTLSNYEGMEYQMALPSPCNLAAGWVMIRVTNSVDPSCRFYWLSSPEGNGTLARKIASFPWEYYNDNLSFCLAAPCPEVDSLVIRNIGPTMNRLYFKATAAGLHKLYHTFWPNGSAPDQLKAQAYLTPGWWMADVATGLSSYARYMVQVDCTPDEAPPMLLNADDDLPSIFVPVERPEGVMPER